MAAPPETTLAQQGSPEPPQATHLDVPPEVLAPHTVPGAVQRLLVQHGSPSAPHDPQAPAEHSALLEFVHALPSALQVALPPIVVVVATQQPPSRQKLPGQQV